MDGKRVRTLTLVATILGSGIALLDATVVNVALPAIDKDLGGGLAGQQWVVNAYLLTLGSLILVGGSLGDLYGERRIFAIGVGAFGLASLLCAVAPTIELLVAARALQGMTSALLTPASLALIATTFSDEKERGAAIGTWTAWGGIATVIGPLAGGSLVDVGSWRWIFVVNVPFVLVTLWLIWVAVERGEERKGARKRRLDLVGAALTTLGLAAPVFALVQQPKRGWGDPMVISGLVTGGVLLALFVLWERRVRDPMLPLGLFRRRNFTFANVETLLVYAGLSSLFFFLTIYLQQVVGWSALESGLAGVPVTVLMFVLSRRFGALAARFGPRLFMGVGPLIAAAGVLLLARADEQVDYLSDILPAIILFGLGLSVTVAPLTATVMADAHRGDSGIASGVNNAVARVAGLLGIATVGVAVAGRSGTELDLAGFRIGMIVTALLVAVGGLVGLLGIENHPGARPEALVSSAP
jgi:EmrB/QacA subfamily drug resistance transporter